MVSLPILFVGYVGGTIYHATRSHVIWLALDVGPIYILAFITGVYCWKRLIPSVLKIALVVFTLFTIPRVLLYFFYEDPGSGITHTYIAICIPILLPIIIYEKQNGCQHVARFCLGFGLILIALFFRFLDVHPYVITNFPIGTHWLWHSLGALGCHGLIAYLRKSTPNALV